MITAIEIENFKGIGERVRIPLKPITLLFGPNSSGKSTILHALHYAREVLEGRSADIDRTTAGGGFVDLGGFRNFVHKRELGRPITFRAELFLPRVSLPSYIEPDFTSWEFEKYVSNACVEFTVQWSALQARPVVTRYEVSINDQPLAAITYQPGRSYAELTSFNGGHPIFAETHGHVLDADSTPVDGRELAEKIARHPIFMFEQESALPRFGALMDFSESHSTPDDSLWSVFEGDDPGRAALTQLIVGPGEVLLQTLRAARYLGPLRETPPRNFEPLRHDDPARWANGLAAWDALYLASNELLGEVSDWVSGPNRLAAGYLLRRTEVLELDAADPAVVQILTEQPLDDVDFVDIRTRLRSASRRTRLVLTDTNTGADLTPADVGEGITQIVPVVVALVEPADGIAAIEQPELHVHPAVQVGLGDLLIQAARRHKEPLIIETHSEHLLLRLLKRIRQTAESDPDLGDFGLRPDDLSVVYMEQGDSGIHATPLRIDQTGEFIDRWPKGFFDERAKELF